MSRLTHSAGGFRRRIQIGRAEVVLLVEGKTDRYFYSRIVANFCSRKNVRCAIRIARELPGGGGGKKSLLQYFDFLRRRGSLASTLAGKQTVVLFLCDKDLDDRTRRLRRSPHIIYTEGYEYENYLFSHGNVVEAGASAAALDLLTVAAVIGDQGAWRRTAATEWKEWVKVCIFSVTRKIRSGGNYGLRPPPINNHPYNGVNSAALNARLKLLENASGLSTRAFTRSWRSVSSYAESLYRSEMQDLAFKGKWYAWFLARDLERAAAGREANLNGLEDRLPDCIALTVNFEDAWADRYRERLSDLLELYGIPE